MGLALEQILIYAVTLVLCGFVVLIYLRVLKKNSDQIQIKVEKAKEEGRFVPISLHPHIDLGLCIGSGACVAACPEKDILGIANGKATVINATSCVGHGACFHACPVEAISLRIGTESRGVELPHIKPSYETNIRGIFIAGELGGMGLIKNSVEQGKQAVENIIKTLKPPKPEVLDLVIVGAGPAGISATLMAKKNNLRYLTLEQDSIGGTVFTFPRQKVVMTQPMDLPLHGKVKLFDTSKHELLELWKEVIHKNEIEIQEMTKVEEIIPQSDDTFKIITNKGELVSNQVLLAIGRRGTPRKLGIRGEDLPKVAYRLIESEKIINQQVLVVGGGDSAVESALLLMEKNNVVLSYRKNAFARIKAGNQSKIDQAIAGKKLQVIFNSNVKEIKSNKVSLSLNEGLIEIPNDLTYIFAGGELPTQFLQKAGIEITKRFNHVVKKH